MLTIYSASAGTGKTHTLTGEYLALLFKGKERHRHILAVTFTNKATAEMKSRIIEELFRLADHQPSGYLEMLSEDGKKNETEIRAQASTILRTILHDFSTFRISTIDSFFQQTLRAFTREIGLQGNYQVELEEELILEKTVEKMISDLEKDGNEALLNWLLHFTEDKIDEMGAWNINRDITKLGKQLFNEKYKLHREGLQKEIQQKQSLFNYRDRLFQIIQSTRRKAKELGEAGVQLMQQYGMHASDFIQGSRSPFIKFEKLAAGEMIDIPDTFRKLEDYVDGYLSKTASKQLKQTAQQIYANGMNGLIKMVIAFFNDLTDYHTAVEIYRNFYALGILTDLSKHITQWREEHNKMLIADTTELLSKIIDGSEIPFIYEKTGVRIEHYMIDEFQDTSAMQWSNFRPLMKDSLDSGRSNLIVGDVKQSIYRFRNSDWKLLDRQLKMDFFNRVNEKSLDVNWRSFRQIVQFNNMLFDAIPSILQQSYNEEVEQSAMPSDEKAASQKRIISAYKNCHQQVAEPFINTEGHVRIQFLSDDEEVKWKEKSMQELPLIVEQLQDSGFDLCDIAILTRTNPDGLLAAETLLDYKEAHPESPYKYDIITEDSLTIGSSLAVRWMIEMLRSLSRPDIKSYREMAQGAYSVLLMKMRGVGHTDSPFERSYENQSMCLFPKGRTFLDDKKKSVSLRSEERSLILKNNVSLYEVKKNGGRGMSKSALEERDMPALNRFFVPVSEEVNAELKRLANRSLYELAEGLFRLFERDIPENELVYIQSFLDLIVEFTAAESTDSGQFLAWWDETGSSKKISTPDSQNAIRIMTIHKSKGLGFRAVIIPFAEWKVDQKEAILWCHPDRKPFNLLSPVPVNYSKKLTQTIFAADYFTEKLHAYIDNLNILYVAFTRAKEELIVLAPHPKTDTPSIAGLLWSGLMTDQQFLIDTENEVYERGTYPFMQPQNLKPTAKHLLAEEWPIEHLPSLSPDKRMVLRLSFQNDLFDEKRKYGLMMHDILSRIEKQEDIAKAISEKYGTGEINREESSLLIEELLSLTSGQEVNEWFNGSMQVLNETDILFGKGQSLRPDRIMIDSNNGVVLVDYKFGEHKEPFHRRQIENYAFLLHEMGYQNIVGCLWYVTLRAIEKYNL